MAKIFRQVRQGENGGEGGFILSLKGFGVVIAAIGLLFGVYTWVYSLQDRVAEATVRINQEQIEGNSKAIQRNYERLTVVETDLRETRKEVLAKIDQTATEQTRRLERIEDAVNR